MKRQTSTVLTAPPGTGKSYMVVSDIVDVILPTSDLRVLTNLYLGAVPASHTFPPTFEGETFVHRIQQYCDQKYGAGKIDAVGRISSIPREWLDSSKEENHKWLLEWDVSNAIIILDEAHNFIGSKHGKESKKAWQNFVGELRHRGGSIIFVTQHPGKLATEVIAEAGLRQALVDAEEERDPFFGIKLYYWYELRAKLLGRYESCFVRIDLRDIDGKKSIRSNVERVKRRQEIFALYDSASAPEAGGVSSSAQTFREFQRRSWPSLLWWFFRLNALRFAQPVSFFLGFLTVLFYGRELFGLVVVLLHMPSVRKEEKQAGVESEKAKQAAVVRTQEEAPEVLALRNRIAALEAEVKKFDAPVRLQACSVEWVMLAGVVYRVGDTVKGGLYDGKNLEQIDFAKRSALVGGVWLHCASSTSDPVGTAARASGIADGENGSRRSREKTNIEHKRVDVN